MNSNHPFWHPKIPQKEVELELLIYNLTMGSTQWQSILLPWWHSKLKLYKPHAKLKVSIFHIMTVVDTYIWQIMLLKKLPWEKGVFIKFGQFFLMWIIGLSFYILIFLVGSWNVGLKLGLQIYKLCSFGCGNFSTPKTFGLVWKSSLVSCTHYKFPNIGKCISTKSYNKLKLGIVFVPNFTTI